MTKPKRKKRWVSARLDEDLYRIVQQVALEQQVEWSQALRYVIRQYADLRRVLIKERIDRMQFSELMTKVNNIKELLKEFVAKE